jgi:hypothetical protein
MDNDEKKTTISVISHAKFGLLGLFLGIGSRPPEGAYDFLTKKELSSLRVVSKKVRRRLEHVEYLFCRDGKEYLVKYPGYPGLAASLYPHRIASLNAMYQMENSNQHFGSLRGGILGDPPGLGKPVTTLALIASTAGQRPVSPPQFWDPEGVQEGWEAMRLNPMGREQILRCLKLIRHNLLKGQLEYLSPPYGDVRFPTLESFKRNVRKLLTEQGDFFIGD